MKIVLDVDGVIADFVGGALRVVNALHPRKQFEPDDVKQWSIELLLPNELRDSFMHACGAPGFCADLEPYPGAIAVVEALRLRHGHENVIFATTPWPCPTWIGERTWWLQHHFGDPTIHHVKDKTGIAGDVFVDDKPSHVFAWAQANPDGRAFLLNRSYNAGDRCTDSDGKNLWRMMRLSQLLHVR